MTDRLRSHAAAMKVVGNVNRQVVGAGRVTGPRIRICHVDDENGLRRDFGGYEVSRYLSPFTLLFTIISIKNDIFIHGTISRSNAPSLP